jgi:hypothetical protein
MNIRKNDLKTESDKTLFLMKYLAEKHFKHIAAKTCKIKSENQVKGKVKAKTTTIVLTIIRHNVQNVGRDL